MSYEPEESAVPGREADSLIGQGTSRDPESEVQSRLRVQRFRDKQSGSKANRSRAEAGDGTSRGEQEVAKLQKKHTHKAECQRWCKTN